MPRIPAVFLDWAGTVVDHGSVAPVKQGFYNSLINGGTLPVAPVAACGITSGPGKVVLSQ